jgi:hypothetical protein
MQHSWRKWLKYLAEFVLQKIHPLFISKTQKIEEAVSQQFNIRDMQLHLACNTNPVFIRLATLTVPVYACSRFESDN